MIRSWSSFRVEMEARKADMIVEHRKQVDYDFLWGNGSYERMKRAIGSGALRVFCEERSHDE